MSISDTLMWTYYELLTDASIAEIDRLKARVAAGELHPKQTKVDLARRIITDFHSSAAAQSAAEEFERVFARKELPSDLPTIEWTLPDEARPFSKLLVDLELATSSSDASRKVKQGGVKLDRVRIDNPLDLLSAHLEKGKTYTLEVGRRAVKVAVH
jgi:tyrosyl-tRNA synthetase